MNVALLFHKKLNRAALGIAMIGRAFGEGRFSDALTYAGRIFFLVGATLIPSLRKFARYPNAAETQDFDRRFGVDTSATMRVEEMEQNHPHALFASYYQASSPKLFQRILADLQIRPETFTFIDCGSGKGIALLLASEYPFRRIIGVEFAANLHRIAEDNVRRFNPPTRKCHAIECVCADVTSFELPIEPIVFYLYNPFQTPVMEGFARNLESSLRKNPREIYVVYVEPLFRDVLDRQAFLERVASAGSTPTSSYVIYRSVTYR